MPYPKYNYVPSEDKTEKTQWNRFYPECWQQFKESFPHIQFVDILSDNPDWHNSLNYWKNLNDTVVFILDLKHPKLGKMNPLSLVLPVKQTYCDEFHYLQISENKYIIRMWWD